MCVGAEMPEGAFINVSSLNELCSSPEIEVTRGVAKRRVASTAEELAEDAAATGPEHQRHTHQRASGDHARRYRQSELRGDLRFAPLDQERNHGPEEEQEPHSTS